MEQNQVILRYPNSLSHERGSERTSECSGGREQSEHSGASERVNGQASGPVLTSLFLFVPDHSASSLSPSLGLWLCEDCNKILCSSCKSAHAEKMGKNEEENQETGEKKKHVARPIRFEGRRSSDTSKLLTLCRL